MSSKVEAQPAFLLHRRPFRETSLILDLLTPDYGRISLMGRGVRSKSSRLKSVLQLFTPLHISFSGKSDLKTLTQAEIIGASPMLRGHRLFSALYLNELLVRLLHGQEGDRALFELYDTTLAAICHFDALEPSLRRFELSLLDGLGYGLDFHYEANTREPLVPDAHYLLIEDSGFVEFTGSTMGHNRESVYPGRALLAIAAGNYEEDEVRRHAKRLMRQCLAAHLGEKPLRSRALFLRGQGKAE